MTKFFLSLLILLCVLASPGYAADVKVRAGIHDRYNRLVFDWGNRVDYTVAQQGNTVTLQFAKDATAQFGSVNAVKPPFVRNLQQESTANGLKVTFDIPDGSRVETFRSGNGIAFDVLRMADGNPPKFTGDKQKPAEPTPPPAATPPVEEKKPEVAAAPAPEAPAPQTIPDKPVQQPAQDKTFHTLADHLAGNVAKPSDEALEKEKPRAPVVPIKGTLIRVDPGQVTKLAAFIRAGKLWMVLDKPFTSLMPLVDGEKREELSQNAKRIDLVKATAFVFDAPAGENVYSVKRIRNEWQILINPGDRAFLPDDIAVTVTYPDKSANPVISLYSGEEPTVVMLKDSTVGDNLWVMPVRAPEGRITQMRVTPSYKVLPTLMGAVIVPQDELLQVNKTVDTLVISSKGSEKLMISDAKDRSLGISETKYIPLFNLDIPGLRKTNFIGQRQQLETRMVDEKIADKKVPILLDLARLNIRNGYGPEALGVLRIAQSMSPKIENTREFTALRGMAAALTGDLAMTKNDLGTDMLGSQEAAKLWLGYAMALNHEWQHARAAFLESGNTLNSFAGPLKPRLVLARAETALRANDIASADQELRRISHGVTMSPSEYAAYEYIRATSALMSKNRTIAMPMYDDLVKGNDHLYRVKALMAATDQKVVDKKLPLKEAIEIYERLRYDWRGDRLEIDILRRLGQYYIDDKNYMEGLGIWRQAAGLSKNTHDTDEITEAMQNVFARLYVQGEVKEMNPLQAVALFERFRELTPPGDEGNKAMISLADRLAAVDLLDQADALLEKQLRQNATGSRAVNLGTKLASWRLLNRNPSGALKALDESTQESNMPESLSQRRLLLRSRALADLGKTDEALSLLNTLQSPEANSLRADINWRQNRWSDAVESMQALAVTYRDDGQTAPDGPMPGLILKMAIAMALDDNKKGIELLIAQYGEYMATTKRADAFSLITKPSRGSALADLQTLKRQVGEVELFQSFLKNF